MDGMVIQRRCSGLINFIRSYSDFANGFGDFDGEFWIGNEYLYRLTSTGPRQLRVDMRDWDGIRVYALYDVFQVASSADNYKLNIGGYSGNAGDSMIYSNNCYFSAMDVDNDNSVGVNCAEFYHGAFWYNQCHGCNPCGDYNNTQFGKGINWSTYKGYYYSMPYFQMSVK